MALNFNLMSKLVKRPAVRAGVLCITMICSSVVSAQRRESPANIRMPYDVMALPEPQRPGTHIMVLRANHAYSNNSMYSYKGYPVIGLLNHGNLDCEHGQRFGVAAQGSGASLVMSAGFGQVAGSGHGASGDRCVAWVTQAAVDFDVSTYASLPVAATLTAATLSYREEESPACLVLAYTQGGFAIDPLRCHTNAQGAPEAKPDGCIVLATPIDDWVAHKPTGVLQTVPNYSKKNGPGSWDVTSLVQSRLNPPLGMTRSALGHGFLFVGPPKSARSLSARNNTRCASMLSDIKLTLRYTVPPYDPRPHPNVIK